MGEEYELRGGAEGGDGFLLSVVLRGLALGFVFGFLVLLIVVFVVLGVGFYWCWGSYGFTYLCSF